MTYYDRIAAGYAELHRDEQLCKIALIRKHMPIKRSDLMLDIGCGPYFGDFDCTVIGVDTSIGLLKQAKIPVILAAAEALPFQDHVFDVVISVTALQNFDEMRKALTEAKRVGKDRFVFTFLKRSDKATMIERAIRQLFLVSERIEEEKDIILVCRNFVQYRV
jgi:ubiquinone/menaquinone biosynthesis C-methylase UbiE